MTLVKKNKKGLFLYFYPTNIFKNTEQMIAEVIKNTSKKYRFIFLGSNIDIPKIIETQKNHNVFYFKNHKTYFITKYIPGFRYLFFILKYAIITFSQQRKEGRQQHDKIHCGGRRSCYSRMY